MAPSNKTNNTHRCPGLKPTSNLPGKCHFLPHPTKTNSTYCHEHQTLCTMCPFQPKHLTHEECLFCRQRRQREAKMLRQTEQRKQKQLQKPKKQTKKQPKKKNGGKGKNQKNKR